MSLFAGLYPLLLLLLGAGILEYLLPAEGSGGKTSAAYRAVAGLCILLAMLKPLTQGLSLLHDLSAGGTDGLRGRLEQMDILPPEDTSAGEKKLADRLAEAGASQVEEWVYAALDSTFGIPARHATVTACVSVDLSDGEYVRLEQVYICLSGSAALRNPHDIESWFSDALGCPVTLSVA